MEESHLNVAFLYPEYSFPWYTVATVSVEGWLHSVSLLSFPPVLSTGQKLPQVLPAGPPSPECRQPMSLRLHAFQLNCDDIKCSPFIFKVHLSTHEKKALVRRSCNYFKAQIQLLLIIQYSRGIANPGLQRTGFQAQVCLGDCNFSSLGFSFPFRKKIIKRFQGVWGPFPASTFYHIVPPSLGDKQVVPSEHKPWSWHTVPWCLPKWCHQTRMPGSLEQEVVNHSIAAWPLSLWPWAKGLTSIYSWKMQIIIRTLPSGF